jgi:hypothetical protein
MDSTPSHIDAKLFYRNLDSLFGTMDAGRSQDDLLKSFLIESYRILQERLRLKAALLYKERGDRFHWPRR